MDAELLLVLSRIQGMGRDPQAVLRALLGCMLPRLGGLYTPEFCWAAECCLADSSVK